MKTKKTTPKEEDFAGKQITIFDATKEQEDTENKNTKTQKHLRLLENFLADLMEVKLFGEKINQKTLIKNNFNHFTVIFTLMHQKNRKFLS